MGYDNSRYHFVAEKRGLYALIDQNTFLPVTPFNFERIEKCCGNGAYLWTRENGKWGLYDTLNNKYIVSPKYNDISRTGTHVNCYTLYITIGEQWWKDGKRGIVNDEGKELVECIYDDVIAHNYDYFTVKLNGKYGLIKDHRFVLNCIYDKLWIYGTHPSILNGVKKCFTTCICS